MRCSRSLLFSAMLLVTLVMFCGVPAFSQDPPNVAMGMSPSATYHGGDFDFVDMATGRLNLRIPLVVDHSQRGKLNFTYSVTFSSTGAWNESTGTFFKIEPPKYGVSSPALVTGGQLVALLQQSYRDDATGNLDFSYSLPEDGYGVGPVHPMGTTSGIRNSGTMESIDGSGIRWSSGAGATNKDGVLGGVWEDANGNERTSSGTYPTTTVADTLGRAWTTTQGNADVTGCPTGGPVAPTSSTIWTVPGPANSVRTFKFCYSTYNVHTNFNDPPYAEYVGTPSLMTGVVLPDGTTWRFDYDTSSISYGDLMAVYPPTGGHIS